MNIKKIIKEETKKQNIRKQEINECVTVLKNLFMKYSLINENGWLKDQPSPTYHWEIPKKEKEEIDRSSKWVKTKDDVLEYIKVFIEEIKSLPKWAKRKFLKYVLYSFMGILSLSQINSMYNNIEKSDFKEFKTEIQKPIVKKEKIRKPSKTLFNHLKKEEGIGGEPVLHFYDLGDGAYTVGYGHAVFSDPSRGSTGGDYPFVPKYENITPNKTTITKSEAEQLLHDDMVKASKGVNNILDRWEEKGIEHEITQGMYDAMVSIAYNHGVKNLRMGDFIQYVKRGEFKKAQEEIKNISSNMFDKYPGLKKRREKESILFAQK